MTSSVPTSSSTLIQLMMKPRYHGTVTDWHQDSMAWHQFAPQEHVSCWVALDDATVDNGCMTVIPGSHKWGPIDRDYKDRFLANPLLNEPLPVELPAGSCMFHHGLNFHRTGANSDAPSSPRPCSPLHPLRNNVPRHRRRRIPPPHRMRKTARRVPLHAHSRQGIPRQSLRPADTAFHQQAPPL